MISPDEVKMEDISKLKEILQNLKVTQEEMKRNLQFYSPKVDRDFEENFREYIYQNPEKISENNFKFSDIYQELIIEIVLLETILNRLEK